MKTVDYQQLATQHGTPLLVLDCARLKRQVSSLQAALPNVGLYYAVKSCPEQDVLATLSNLNVGFDVASAGELKMLSPHNVSASRIIHTHPIKPRQEIRDALRFGCTTFVVDNVAEIEKFAEFRSRVGLLLRVAVDNPRAVVNLSHKFGCAQDEAQSLIEKADELGIHVKGLSFHVGSQSDDAAPYIHAIEFCNQLIRWSRQRGKPLRILDIGGGFPASYRGETFNIKAFCTPIRKALLELPLGVEVIAEPGRFISAPAVTSVASVIGKSQRNGRQWYYLDDGVYGSFSGQIYDHAKYPVHSLKQGDKLPSVLAGPTCDSIDVICESIELPALDIGDLIIGEQMGAYTSASASNFNGLKQAKVVAVNAPKLPAGVVAFRRRA
jgi:ornithine decarboxylase